MPGPTANDLLALFRRCAQGAPRWLCGRCWHRIEPGQGECFHCGAVIEWDGEDEPWRAVTP